MDYCPICHSEDVVENDFDIECLDCGSHFTSDSDEDVYEEVEDEFYD